MPAGQEKSIYRANCMAVIKSLITCFFNEKYLLRQPPTIFRHLTINVRFQDLQGFN